MSVQPSAPSRALVLCADDYALHPYVDSAVLQLAQAGRLSATSCMTTSPLWPAAAPLLHVVRDKIAVGLHFNLTESHQGSVTAQPLGSVIRQAYTATIKASAAWTPQALRQLWRQQLDAFEHALGTPPDFIDGHQHVHQLPGVREAMLAELQSRYSPTTMPWVRSTAPAGSLWRNPKASVIALLGGWQHTRQLRAAGVAVNDGFGGVYGFDAPDTATYGAHMAQWLPHMTHGSLMMCHPGTGLVPGDAIAAQRPVELAYLQSEQFGLLLAQQHIHIHQGGGNQLPVRT